MTHEKPELNVPEYDVIVVGGGMVGSMLCAALASDTDNNHSLGPNRQDEPLRVCVLEHQLPAAFEPGSEPAYDLRVSALSIASEQMLKRVGAWEGIKTRRACEYKRLSVWDGERDGRTDFNCADINADHLGHIVENRVIQLALMDVLSELTNVTVVTPARLSRFRQLNHGVEVVLDSGNTVSARLLVGADGANSVVRQQAGIAMEKKLYPQHALVANVQTALSQQDITWQRFVPTGAQAFLPLCGQQGSIVWYHSKEEIEQLKSLDEDAFLQALQQSFPEELGPVEAIHARGAFPIAKAHAKDYVANRVALVGDAAHTVHPLAGQGVNIGLLDAAALAQVIHEAVAKGRDPGTHAVLRRYQRWRYGDNQLMITALDSLYEAFKPRPMLVQQLRSASLNLVDQMAPIKHQLMRHAMGVSGDLPDIAR